MKSIDLNLLAALDALLSTGSVSAAAQRMHLSTPAMSHTLARIRAALGDPILVRAGRGLTPTARAIELREPVRRLVADARHLMESGDRLALPDVQREFVVRAPDSIAVVHGAELLAAIRQTMPAATLRFVPETDSDSMALREGRIDVDIGTLHDRGPEIRASLLYEQQLVGAVRAGHALAANRVTLKRLAAQSHVAIAQRGGAREAVDRVLSDAGIARRIALTVPSAYAALMVAARSDLVACAPEPLVRGVSGELGLVMIRLPVDVPAEQVLQAWHPRVDADAAHRCLRRCIGTLLKPKPPRSAVLGPSAAPGSGASPGRSTADPDRTESQIPLAEADHLARHQLQEKLVGILSLKHRVLRRNDAQRRQHS